MGQLVNGDVVVLPFPQTDLQAGKRRPALVVANLPGKDMILCQITSQAHESSRQRETVGMNQFPKSGRRCTAR